MNNPTDKWNSASRRSYSTNSEGYNQRREGARPRFNSGYRAERTASTGDSAEGQRPRRPRFNSASAEGSRPQRQRVRFQTGDYQSSPSFRQNDRDTQNRRFDRHATSSRDSVYSKKKQFEYRQKNEDPTKPIRLNKYLANAGICSRREADDFIQAGVITVNGQTVTTLGAKVLPTDEVKFNDQRIRRERKVYILLNKPKNTVTTTDDPQERNTVLDIVQRACSERIYPVGRLDRNTTGVLLLTNDGDLAAKLTHPKFGKKKVYAVTLDRELSADDEQQLRAGITLDDELIVPDALEFPKDDRQHIGLEIHSGQNRVVRRMFEKVGYKVLQLDRVSFAGLTKKNVPRGKFRFLTPKEVSMLQMGAFE